MNAHSSIPVPDDDDQALLVTQGELRSMRQDERNEAARIQRATLKAQLAAQVLQGVKHGVHCVFDTNGSPLGLHQESQWAPRVAVFLAEAILKECGL